MNKKIAVHALALVIATSFLAIPARSRPVQAKPNVIEVPIDFSTVQAAIDSASDGDTIFIHNDIYMENVVVDKTLSILGESRTGTVIDGNNTGTTLTVAADNVSVQNVTIRGGGSNVSESGIRVTGSLCRITNNLVINNSLYGIHLDSCSNASVSENLIAQNSADGIVLFGSANNTVSANVVENSMIGIHLYTSVQNNIVNNTLVNNNQGGINLLYSSSNLVADNNVTENTGQGIMLMFSSNNNTLTHNVVDRTEGYGVTLDSSSNNVLRNNHMLNNFYNLYFPATQPILTDFLNDVDTSNTVDGKTVYYFVDQQGLVIDQSTAADAGYVGLINCSWMIVRNLNLSRNGQGMLLAFTDNSVVTQLNISNNLHGVQLLASDDNAVTKSIITSNFEDGVSVDYLSSGNFVANNNILNNSLAVRIAHQYTDRNEILNNRIINNQKGFWIYSYAQGNIISQNVITDNDLAISMQRGSDENMITKNIVANNSQGLFIEDCYNNEIFSNNFVNNTVQAVSSVSKNYWDNGYINGGNFWSDYNGIDQDDDGIGDTPYFITEDADSDGYPLMGIFNEFEVSNKQGQTGRIQMVCNSTVSNFTLTIENPSSSLSQQAQEYILFLVTGNNDTAGFCRASIPKSLFSGPYKVLVDDREVSAKTLAFSNATQTYLYFTYEHSTHEVIIVPEFSLAAMVLLLILCTSMMIACARFGDIDCEETAAVYADFP